MWGALSAADGDLLVQTRSWTRATAKGLNPEAEWGRAPCDRRGVAPQNPSGEGPRATAEGLGPRSRVGQGNVRPPRG